MKPDELRMMLAEMPLREQMWASAYGSMIEIAYRFTSGEISDHYLEELVKSLFRDVCIATAVDSKSLLWLLQFLSAGPVTSDPALVLPPAVASSAGRTTAVADGPLPETTSPAVHTYLDVSEGPDDGYHGLNAFPEPQ